MAKHLAGYTLRNGGHYGKNRMLKIHLKEQDVKAVMEAFGDTRAEAEIRIIQAQLSPAVECLGLKIAAHDDSGKWPEMISEPTEDQVIMHNITSFIEVPEKR